MSVAGDVTHYGFNIVIVLYCLQPFQFHSIALFLCALLNANGEKNEEDEAKNKRNNAWWAELS